MKRRLISLGLLVAVVSACESRRAARAGLPLSFEPNRGQTDARVDFLARGAGHAAFLSAGAAVVVLTRPDSTGVALRTTFPGANRRPRATGLETLPGKANYFVGKDPTPRHADVPLYAKVRYSQVYPGIDLHYSGDQSRMAYEFVVHPGAEPARIRIGWEGADSLVVDAHGDVVLHTAAGVVRQERPAIYQKLHGTRRKIAGGYVRKGAHQVGLDIAAYDAERPLVVTSTVPLLILGKPSS
jgi:hypothetical protein